MDDEKDQIDQTEATDDGIGPPAVGHPGEGLAPPDDESDPDLAPPDGSSDQDLDNLSQDLWVTRPSFKAPFRAPGIPAFPPSSGGWPGSTAPIGLPPPPPPLAPKRRGVLIVVLAVLLIAGGTVAGVLALSKSSKEKPAVAATHTVAPSASLVPPAELTASGKPFAVTLHWTQRAGGTPIENYVIYRNHTLVDQIPAESTSFEDNSVSPGKKYTYELKAKSGVLTTDSVTVVVSTPKPGVSEARLSGDFNVKIHLVSSSGFQSLQNNPAAGWHFQPKCKTGPCDVTWTDIVEKSVKAGLNRKGASYSGTDSSTVFSTCSGRDVNSVATVTIKVTKATGLSGVWRASRFEGTLEFTASPQLGCVSTGATFTVTGTLLQ